MATATQVPWTDPGGTPCCCQDACFTDFANEPRPVYADGSFVAISEEAYAALYAGGTYAATLNLSVQGNRDNVGGNPLSVATATELHSFSGAVNPVALDIVDSPCYEKYAASVTIARDVVNRDVQFSSPYTASLQFSRSLGTQAGQRYLSLATVNGPSAASSIGGFLTMPSASSAFPQNIVMRSGNMTNTVPYSCQGNATYTPNLSNVASSASLLVAGQTYSAPQVVAHPCFSTAGHFDQVINGSALISFGFSLFGSVAGSFSLQLSFTPAAP